MSKFEIIFSVKCFNVLFYIILVTTRYQQRKANAIVWLMRRATRAMHQTIRLEEADKYLRVLGKRAKVLAELLEIGAKVVSESFMVKKGNT